MTVTSEIFLQLHFWAHSQILLCYLLGQGDEEMGREAVNATIGMAAAIAIPALAIGRAFSHANAQARIRRAEQQQEAEYLAAIGEVAGEAEALGEIALQLVAELAELRSQNEKLTSALQQRQAFIERMRSNH